MGDGQFDPLSLKTLPTWGTLLGMRGGGSTWQPIGFGTSDSDDYGQGADDGLFAGGSTSYGTRSTSGMGDGAPFPKDKSQLRPTDDSADLKPGSAEMPYVSQNRVSLSQPIDGTDLNGVVYSNRLAGVTDANGNPVHPVHVADAVADLSQTHGASFPGGPNARYGDDYSKLTPKSSYLDLMNSKQVASSQPIGGTGLHHVVYSTGDAAVHDTDGNPLPASQVVRALGNKYSSSSPVGNAVSSSMSSKLAVRASSAGPSRQALTSAASNYRRGSPIGYHEADSRANRVGDGFSTSFDGYGSTKDAYYLEYQGMLNGSLTRQQAYYPKWVSVDYNIRHALAARNAFEAEYAGEPATAFARKNKWFYDRVRPHGPWDYKRANRKYENFGNFNYGATGAALGLPLDYLLKVAGGVQIYSHTSTPGFWSSNFDDPVDQLAIKAGWEYFHLYYNGQRIPPKL